MVFKILKNFARGVLDDDTSSPIVQIEFLKDFLSKHKYVYSQNFEENLSILKKKHLVDSFLVTNLDGSIVVSSEGNGHTDGIMGTAMLSYIKSELPDSESVLIKRNDGWFMLFSLNKKVFIVKAGSELSNIELRALSIELESLLSLNKTAGDRKKLTQVA
ncbi:MAG: hypothetical protein PHY04_01235 [Candidatus ainarchaeum sp.]|nr:hypothetical protein [Candidatus ainarchaeum sp.]MDD3085570.1 hypothetical protein [Candidatus ainarchaeum sp.]MDD4128340.1 hypothetical protein [Candidatus ainarchaeum sp.]MDD4467991.1 hypothetical protein [Candidatus ainarchaeum sp.]HPM85728.1 hypothetical protein [archaeon]